MNVPIKLRDKMMKFARENDGTAKMEIARYWRIEEGDYVFSIICEQVKGGGRG